MKGYLLNRFLAGDRDELPKPKQIICFGLKCISISTLSCLETWDFVSNITVVYNFEIQFICHF